MGRYIEQLRVVQGEAVARYLELRGIAAPIPPMSLTLVIAAIARQMVREKDFGVTLGHAELTAAVEAMLAGLPATA